MIPLVVDVIELITKPSGSTSVIITPVAGRFPLFSSSRVYENGTSSVMFCVLTDFVIVTFAYSSRLTVSKKLKGKEMGRFQQGNSVCGTD